MQASVAVLAEISLRSPRKLFILIIKKYIYRSKVSKKNEFNLEKLFTDAGGSVAILDFNNSEDSIVDGVQALFLSQLVVPAAKEKGLEAEYEYLRPSIKAFPTGTHFLNPTMK